MFNYLWGTNTGNSGSKSWFSQYGWILTLILSVILVAAFIVVVIMLIKTKNNKTQAISNPSAYIEALGGKENIVSCEAKSSRLVVVLKDNSLMNKEQLKELGLDSLIESSEKVTFIAGEKSSEIAKELTK